MRPAYGMLLFLHGTGVEQAINRTAPPVRRIRFSVPCVPCTHAVHYRQAAMRLRLKSEAGADTINKAGILVRKQAELLLPAGQGRVCCGNRISRERDFDVHARLV